MTNLKSTLALLLLLAACGGGGGGSSTPTPSPTPTPTPAPAPTPGDYQTLKSTAAKTSPLGGTVLRSNSRSGALTLVAVTGSMTHNTGATTVRDGLYALQDRNGPDVRGVLSDGAVSLTMSGSQGFSTSYDYVTPYQMSYQVSGTPYDATGFLGVVTSAADVAAAKTATYRGEASATMVTPTRGFDLTKGQSTVTANFGSKTATVTLTNFVAIDQATGAVVSAPLDTIKASGLTISGSTFDGSSAVVTNNGNVVFMNGASTAVHGTFFGYDRTISAPDEVAGMLTVVGSDTIIIGQFIAD